MISYRLFRGHGKTRACPGPDRKGEHRELLLHHLHLQQRDLPHGHQDGRGRRMRVLRPGGIAPRTPNSLTGKLKKPGLIEHDLIIAVCRVLSCTRNPRIS